MIPKEIIPDSCRLFLRVHRKNIWDDKPVPGAFREHGEGDNKSMSTDWGKHSSAEEARSRANVPQSNSIIRLIVGDLRAIALQVTHNPDSSRNNPAHTDVKGIAEDKDLKNKVRLQLLDLYEWVIKLS